MKKKIIMLLITAAVVASNQSNAQTIKQQVPLNKPKNGFINTLSYSSTFNFNLDTSYHVSDTTYSASGNYAYMQIRWVSKSNKADAKAKFYYNGKFWELCAFEILPLIKFPTLYSPEMSQQLYYVPTKN